MSSEWGWMAARTLPLCGVPGWGFSRNGAGGWANAWSIFRTDRPATMLVKKARLCMTQLLYGCQFGLTGIGPADVGIEDFLELGNDVIAAEGFEQTAIEIDWCDGFFERARQRDPQIGVF